MLQTRRVGQGVLHTEQGVRASTATLRVPAAWLQALPRALAGGVFALVLQAGTVPGILQTEASGVGHSSALLALESAPWAGAAASLVYGPDE
ncbi:MAG: hypothetical protein ACK4OE_00015 [Acidovorax sp.]|uniref:hypothetical protein n=1 Tax=Acidovorax sp. TaxID=1872122 RepID=UPI00391BAAB8